MSRPLLARELLEPGTPPVAGWFYMLHGFLGSGRNWRSVARRLVDREAGWGGVLVDLRLHGRSTGFLPPHTIEAAAADLEALAADLGADPSAVLGHSFGGKVALQFLARASAPPRQVWIFDATPDAGAPVGGARDTLSLLREEPGPFVSRQEAIAALARRGLDDRAAAWLATNLEVGADGAAWRPDPDALEELLRSFAAKDLWPVVDEPPWPTEIHIVRAESSDVLTARACERIRDVGERTGRVFLHRLAGGHWLNVDNPDGLLALLARFLA